MAAEIMELLIIGFDDAKSADEALKELKEAQKEGLIEITNAATMSKDDKGKTHYKEIADLKARSKGRKIGGAAGALVFLLGGPAGIVLSTVAGVATGGLVSRFKDRGIPNEDLKEVADMLEKNESLIVALVEHVWIDKVIDEVAEYSAEVVRKELEDEVTQTLLEEEN